MVLVFITVLLMNIYILRIYIEDLTITNEQRKNDMIKTLDIRQKVTEGFRASYQMDFNLENKVDMMYDNMTEMIKNLSSAKK